MPKFYQDNVKIRFSNTHVKFEGFSSSRKANKQKMNWVRLAEHGRIPSKAICKNIINVFLCKIEIIKYGLLYCDLLYTLRIGVFDGFLSYKKTIVIMESTTEKRNISMLYWDEAKKGMMAGFIFSLFILLLFSFVSCDKDEDTSFEETPYYLGYFEGKVNSQDISIANQSNSHSFIDHGNFWQEVNTDLSGFYWEIPLGVHISDYP